MDHALSFAFTAGLLGLTLFSALLLHHWRHVFAALGAPQIELAAYFPAGAAASGLPVQIVRMSPAPREPRPADAHGEEIGPIDHADEHASVHPHPQKGVDTLISVPTFDAEGNPRSRRVRLDVLLGAVGIDLKEVEPGLAVITQAQSEILALGELASRIGPDTDEFPDISHLGIALIGISRRLDVAVELFDSMQTARRTDEGDDDSTESPTSGQEPPASDEDDPS
jgi:hypothetical protein